MKKLITIVLLLLAILFGLGLIFGVFEREKPIPSQRVHFDFEVGSKVGINADPDAFHFGIVSPGGSGRRVFNFTNTHSYPLKGEAFIVANETIGSWFYIEPNPYILPANSTTVFGITVTIPENTSYANYSGDVVFNLTRADDGDMLLINNGSNANVSANLSMNASGNLTGHNLTTDTGVVSADELNSTGSS